MNPFTSTHSIEGGLKLIRRNSTSHATSEVKELGEGVWLPADLQPLVEYRHVQNIAPPMRDMDLSMVNGA